MKGLIRITLLSDLCVSDGGAYNSMLDTDICYDQYGFPYIPARRLRGCLRECSVELVNWGAKLDTDKVFGKAGNQSAAVRIGNAYLHNSSNNKSLVRNYGNHPFLHPQNILNEYSYIRTQTEINSATGTADPASLRSMRVAKKGLVFESVVEVRDENAADQLEMCCHVLSHMGIARTRGFGEVKAEFIKDTVSNLDDYDSVQHGKLVPDAVSMTVSVRLLDPFIAKSYDSGEAKTMDYIEGAKILGLIAQGLKDKGESFTEFMAGGKLVCSNAYVAIDGKRSQEVPACFYEIKNNDSDYINRLYAHGEEEDNKGEQISQMKHTYVVVNEDGGMEKNNVRIQQRYHHARPADKSIGRAKKSEDSSNFYQMSSICEGQTFNGMIYGSPEQIRKIYEIITSRPDTYMGYARTSEYGKVRVTVNSTESSMKSSKIKGKSFAFVLKAPAVVYSDRAFYTTNAEDLIREILAAVGKENSSEQICAVDKYMKYTTLGGFNVTWGMKKPNIGAFGAGTVIVIHFSEETVINIPSALFIGERTAEGYGELQIIKVEENEKKYRCSILGESTEQPNTKLNASQSDLAASICRNKLSSYIKEKAIAKADEVFDSVSYRPVVSNMLLMCDENNSLESIENVVQNRYGKSLQSKQNKKAMAEKILNEVKDNTKDLCRNFCNEYGVTGYTETDEWVRMQYLKDFLAHGKYRIRQTRGGSNG